MKKITFTFLAFISLFAANVANGQACSGGAPTCTPQGIPATAGFQDLNTVPCVVNGTAYSGSLNFKMYSTFQYPGVPLVNVDSIKFTSITGLPTGICWNTNKASNTFAAGEYGCIGFSGTATSAGGGQYKLSLTMDAYVNQSSTPQHIGAFQVDQAGIKLYLRVQMANGQCANIDTAIGTAVNEVDASIASFNIIPNPVVSNAVVLFTTTNNSNVTMRITDMTGKVISSREVEAREGDNSVSFERNGLPAGIYFVSLNSGTLSVTKRFSIIE